MRAILALLLLILCMGISTGRQSRMRKRAALLGALQRDITALKDAMSLTTGRLADQAVRLNSEELHPFWQKFASMLSAKETAEEIWRNLVKEESESGMLFCLKIEDTEVLSRVGEALSLPGRETQAARLSFHARELEQQKILAETEVHRKGKMVLSLGTLIGLALALMVL